MAKLAKALSAAAGSAGGTEGYVEDVFSTYLYDGNSTDNTAVNIGLDMSGEGGLVWNKRRDGATDHVLIDTARGVEKYISTNDTAVESSYSGSLKAFTSTGYTMGTAHNYNGTGGSFASWNFRKQKGFFDLVKFSTTGGGGQQTVSHNLGSIPGTIILKQITSGADGYWYVINKNVTSPNSDWWLNYANLNVTAAFAYWGSTAGIYSAPTSSAITVSTYFTNQTADFIAYFFAEGGSDDQIFGDDGDEAIIKCGVFTGDGTNGIDVDLGWEPQWVLAKYATSVSDWFIMDAMRGMPATTDAASKDAYLTTASNNPENISYNNIINPLANGFHASNNWWGAVPTVYIAIRRGPMKEPSAGTDVLGLDASHASAYENPFFQGSNVVDHAFYRTSTGGDNYSLSRLLQGKFLRPTSTGAAGSSSQAVFDYMNGFYDIGSGSAPGYYTAMFTRYPKVFDVVVYAGNATPSIGVRNGLVHNLGVAPELIIHKGIDTTTEWQVGATPVSKGGYLNLTNSFPTSFTPANEFTATTFDVDGWIGENGNNVVGEEYVCYLFATLAGVSKVGSYTGTGNTLNVDCGFSGGVRWVMIKRIDATGDWYVYDSLRGIVAGNDDYYLINTTGADVTNTDYIDPLASGFTVTSSAPAALNASGGTYLFLAFA